MTIIRSIGYIQIRIFAFIAWLVGVYGLYELWGGLGILAGFSPLVIVGPIYHFFENGFDTRTIVFVFSVVFTIIGAVIFYQANEYLEKHEEESSEF